MRSKLKFVATVACVVLALDHISKWFIVRTVKLGEEIPVWAGYFDIVHGRNSGAAFGFLSGWDSPYRNWFFYFIAVLAAIFVYHYIKSLHGGDRLSLLAIGFIAGGAMGNVVDRLCRGSVVDFLSLHIHDNLWRFELFSHRLIVPLTWPAFNLADTAISIAVVLLIVQSFRKRT